jgi:branched-chain amino acid transport system ATP-binding protein
MSAPVLETLGLSKSFGGIDAVTDVSLSVNENEVCALIGPNGAGKSTFVGLVCGRILPTRGKVLFDGQDISTLPAHARIRLGVAYTFQITSVFANLPVLENVSLAARRALASSNAGLRNRKRAVHERAMSALENVGLADSSAQTAGNLSYGHQRLLEIAMGLAQTPRLFIMDEPTQGLALDEIERFKELLTRLSSSTTILLIEHNMDVVMDTANRIAVLDAGELIGDGTPAEVRSDPRVQASYLGTQTDEAPP